MKNNETEARERRLLKRLVAAALLLVTACIMLTAVLREVNSLPCVKPYLRSHCNVAIIQIKNNGY